MHDNVRAISIRFVTRCERRGDTTLTHPPPLITQSLAYPLCTASSMPLPTSLLSASLPSSSRPPLVMSTHTRSSSFSPLLVRFARDHIPTFGSVMNLYVT